MTEQEAAVQAWIEEYRKRHPDSQKRHERRLRYGNIPRDSRGRFAKTTNHEIRRQP